MYPFLFEKVKEGQKKEVDSKKEGGGVGGFSGGGVGGFSED